MFPLILLEAAWKKDCVSGKRHCKNCLKAQDTWPTLVRDCATNGLKDGGNFFWHKNMQKWIWHIESQARLCGARQPMRRSVTAVVQPHTHTCRLDGTLLPSLCGDMLYSLHQLAPYCRISSTATFFTVTAIALWYLPFSLPWFILCSQLWQCIGTHFWSCFCT